MQSVLLDKNGNKPLEAPVLLTRKHDKTLVVLATEFKDVDGEKRFDSFVVRHDNAKNCGYKLENELVDRYEVFNGTVNLSN